MMRRSRSLVTSAIAVLGVIGAVAGITGGRARPAGADVAVAPITAGHAISWDQYSLMIDGQRTFEPASTAKAPAEPSSTRAWLQAPVVNVQV